MARRERKENNEEVEIGLTSQNDDFDKKIKDFEKVMIETKAKWKEMKKIIKKEKIDWTWKGKYGN